MYNKNKTILYFTGLNRDFYKLGIYVSNFKEYINSNSLYLEKYAFTTSLVPTATLSSISVPELIEQLAEDRKGLNLRTGKGKGVTILNTENSETLTFKSLKVCADHHTSIGLKVTGATLKT